MVAIFADRITTDRYGQVSTAGTESYTYDAVGQRLSEVLVSGGGVTLVDAQASYDTLGRLTWWNQNSAAYTNGGSSYTTPQTTNNYYYDALGNVRREASSYKTIDAVGGVGGTVATSNYYYRYDTMNRLVLDKGTLSGTAIVRALAGQDITYDAAGQRTSVARTDYIAGTWPSYLGFYQETRELYDYDGVGRIGKIRVSVGAAVAAGSYTGTVSAAPSGPSDGTRRSEFTYDLMGRQLSQSDYMADGTTVAYSRTATYDLTGKVGIDHVSTRRGSDIYSSDSSYSYVFQIGALSHTRTDNWKNGTIQDTKDVDSTYEWWDSALQSSITYTTSIYGAPSTSLTTTFTYDGLGRLTWIYVGDGRPRNIGFRNNGDGQIIRRDELDNNNTNGDPHEAWYRFGGKQMAYVGNNGSVNMNAPASIADRQTSPGSGAFRYGAVGSTNSVDTTGNYDAINSYRQGAAGGSYTVARTGENLRGIAQGLWGDSSLWYKLAEANGMAADASLIEGQRLTIPTGVVRSTHNADTFRPYDPASAIGDVSPTTPMPQKKGCSLGAIFLSIIAIAVAAIIGPEIIPALQGALGAVGGAVVGGALAGAAGSVVSQGIGLMTGLQDSFSWKGVALSALGGAVGGGVGQVFGKGAMLGSQLVGDVVRGAVTSAITQGVAVATGLQDKFSWAGVAAAGIGAGAFGAVMRGLNSDKGHFAEGAEKVDGVSYGANDWVPDAGFEASFGSQALAGGAALLANAATRSAIEGSNFGDNIMAALPDTIGSIVGNALGRAAAKALEKAKTESGDVIVEARKGAQSGAATGTADGPLSSDDRQFWQRHNPYALEKEEIPDLEQELTVRQTERQREIAKRQTARDGIAAQLEAAEISGASASRIASLQRGLAAAGEKLKSTTAQYDEKVAQQTQRLDTANADLVRLRNIESRVTDWARGQTVLVDGQSYKISGPGASFTNVENAARDGIAFAFLVQSAMGDNWERGADIRAANGSFTYGRLSVGALFSRNHTLGSGRVIAANTPFLPGISGAGAAFFHIHPLGQSEDQNFSTGDLSTYKSLFENHVGSPTPAPLSYLGGNDGSFDVFRPNSAGTDFNNTTLGRSGYFGTKKK